MTSANEEQFQIHKPFNFSFSKLFMARKFIQGNDAIAQGALDAGMGFYAGYPITPASEIMHYLANVKGIKFLQAEDEIASVNLCLGASLAGVKSMTATSGPGFSLMQEGIGFGHMARIPTVIVDVQRVGPSTGMPTLGSQGEVLQSKNGGHGDYYPIVFTPGSVEELYKYTIESFNCAEQARIPVILLSDGMLSQMYESVELKQIKLKNRINKSMGHVTGLLSEGDLPRTKDSDYYKRWFAKYKKEILKVAESYAFYEYSENKDSENLIICFGGVSRVLNELKKDYSIFRPIRLFPVLEKELKKAVDKHKKVSVVEMNDGQYAGELRKYFGDKIVSVPVLGGKINVEGIRGKLR